jgi:hypothetical protein
MRRESDDGGRHAQRQPDALDRAEQRRDAEMELRHTDPEAWRQQLAERNREVHRRLLTESKDSLDLVQGAVSATACKSKVVRRLLGLAEQNPWAAPGEAPPTDVRCWNQG